uniref:Putative secreted protein n=1 Tax=Anopheles triannulatus TaxID=58253 RepID=A0A2M4B6U3_9DIPT
MATVTWCCTTFSLPSVCSLCKNWPAPHFRRLGCSVCHPKMCWLRIGLERGKRRTLKSKHLNSGQRLTVHFGFRQNQTLFNLFFDL